MKEKLRNDCTFIHIELELKIKSLQDKIKLQIETNLRDQRGMKRKIREEVHSEFDIKIK